MTVQNKESYQLDKSKLNTLEQSQLDQLLIEACLASDLDAVKYLLTSPEITTHASINGCGGEAFIVACRTKNIELIDYMLCSPELKEHANIHVFKDSVFKDACNKKNIESLNYFLFDYKINNTEEIAHYLEKNELEKISHIFENRETSNKLNNDDFPKEKHIIIKDKTKKFKKNK